MWIVRGKSSKIRYAERQSLDSAQRALKQVAKEQYCMESLFELVSVCPRCKRCCPCHKAKAQSSEGKYKDALRNV